MAGIDNAVNLLQNDRVELFKNFRDRYEGMMTELQKCRRLSFLKMEKGQDIGKLIISGKSSGVSGQEIYNILLHKYHLQLEMASSGYCLAMFTIWDGEEAYRRMTEALFKIDRQLCEEGMIQDAAYYSGYNVTELLTQADDSPVPLWKAWDMECEYIPIAEAAGRYAGEFVNLYPPGIPLLVPGERFTDRLCHAVEIYIRQGLNVQGVKKSSETGQYMVKVLADISQLHN
jgi:arginine/lysine/ornithine decarboxylase